MDPQMELDRLLSARLNDADAHLSSADPEAHDLLEVVDRLQPLRAATPADSFADGLQQRLMAYTRRRAHEAQTVTEAPVTSAPPGLRSWGRSTTARRRAPLLWGGIAACLLIALGATFGAAVYAAPGSSLYGVKRIEQNLQSNLTTDATARARLHLANANDALHALNATIAARSTGQAYTDALAALGEEDTAAATNVAAIPAGREQDSLTRDLATLRARERADLLAALPALSWSARIATSAVLDRLGAPTPHITHVQIISEHGSGGDSNGEDALRIVVDGSGFAPQAVMLVNDRPVGVMLSVTPTQAIARIAGGGGALEAVRSVGIGNPDGSAARATNIQSNDEPGHGREPTTTPGKGDDGNGGQGSGGGDQSKGKPTPAPASTPHGGDH